MQKAIYFDMDGTIADLYGVENWLADLQAYNSRPYENARPLINLSVLARRLNTLQSHGYKIGIVSWLSKTSTEEYDEAVTAAKKKWLASHLKSVRFDEVRILEYGAPKHQNVECPFGILFDDEARNRDNWAGIAYDEKNILEILKNL